MNIVSQILIIILLLISKIIANDSLWVKFVSFYKNLIITFCFRVFKSLNVQNFTAPMVPTVAASPSASSAPLASPTSKKPSRRWYNNHNRFGLHSKWKQTKKKLWFNTHLRWNLLKNICNCSFEITRNLFKIVIKTDFFGSIQLIVCLREKLKIKYALILYR